MQMQNRLQALEHAVTTMSRGCARCAWGGFLVLRRGDDGEIRRGDEAQVWQTDEHGDVVCPDCGSRPERAIVLQKMEVDHG